MSPRFTTTDHRDGRGGNAEPRRYNARKFRTPQGFKGLRFCQTMGVSFLPHSMLQSNQSVLKRMAHILTATAPFKIRQHVVRFAPIFVVDERTIRWCHTKKRARDEAVDCARKLLAIEGETNEGVPGVEGRRPQVNPDPMGTIARWHDALNTSMITNGIVREVLAGKPSFLFHYGTIHPQIVNKKGVS